MKTSEIRYSFFQEGYPFYSPIGITDGDFLGLYRFYLTSIYTARILDPIYSIYPLLLFEDQASLQIQNPNNAEETHEISLLNIVKGDYSQYLLKDKNELHFHLPLIKDPGIKYNPSCLLVYQEGNLPHESGDLLWKHIETRLISESESYDYYKVSFKLSFNSTRRILYFNNIYLKFFLDGKEWVIPFLPLLTTRYLE